MTAIVTLTTDFGTADGYVGAMKGVILSRCPTAQVVDLSHEIAPQAIRDGAWALKEAAWTFPRGTIHVAVVDPGVGGERLPIAVQSGGMVFVGPDNGLLSLATKGATSIFRLDNANLHRRTVSSTFHGRDIFASVAGHLAAGVSIESCGSQVSSMVELSSAPASLEAGEIRGEVVHVDRFGNLITNIDGEMLASHHWLVFVDDRNVGEMKRTFSDAAHGEWLAYLGSGGKLEVAVREGNAGKDVTRGAQVRLCKKES